MVAADSLGQRWRDLRTVRLSTPPSFPERRNRHLRIRKTLAIQPVKEHKNGSTFH